MLFKEIPFFLGLTFILMHEMDAIRCKEWQIFPGLSSLKNDRLAFQVFMLLHIPLFYFVLAFLFINEDNSFRLGFDYFLIIHLMLHLLFLMHSKNQFKDWLSWFIISGAAICGMIDIILFRP